jgi:hypothetical protein
MGKSRRTGRQKVTLLILKEKPPEKYFPDFASYRRQSLDSIVRGVRQYPQLAAKKYRRERYIMHRGSTPLRVAMRAPCDSLWLRSPPPRAVRQRAMPRAFSVCNSALRSELRRDTQPRSMTSIFRELVSSFSLQEFNEAA